MFRKPILATGALFALSTPAPGPALDAPSLRARANSQIVQNRRADQDDLSRIRNLSMLRRFVGLDLLVPVPARTTSYYLKGIPSAYRYVRPWSKLFLDRLSSQFHARFRKPLRVTSLVRTVTLQQRLQRRNGNAASARGDRRSTHLTGATIDISKKGMSRAQLSWMRRVLASLKSKGFLYAVEEQQQPVFHVMVFKNYPEYVESLE